MYRTPLFCVFSYFSNYSQVYFIPLSFIFPLIICFLQSSILNSLPIGALSALPYFAHTDVQTLGPCVPLPSRHLHLILLQASQTKHVQIATSQLCSSFILEGNLSVTTDRTAVVGFPILSLITMSPSHSHSS